MTKPDSPQTVYSFFTAPSGPESINTFQDVEKSYENCVEDLAPLLHTHDGFLVACYSQHPLVPWLKDRLPRPKQATGIFEASIAYSLLLLHQSESFGIVSTGKVWEDMLSAGVKRLLGEQESSHFAGVETTGLNATDLHDAAPEVVREKVKEATKRLVGKGGVGAICLGCAGMSGMNEMIREAAVESLGAPSGSNIRIVDGVQAGVAWLHGALRMTF
jgi:Asp/Glu/hydantoin racemase